MKIEALIKKQNLIIGLVILFIGLIIARNVYLNQDKKAVWLKDEINQSKEKEAILKDIQILEKRIETYKEKFAKREVTSLIEELAKNAGICNLKVSSILPEREIIEEDFLEQPIKMGLIGGYHNLGKFLVLLEKNLQIKVREVKLSIEKADKENLRSSILVSLVCFKE